MSVFTMCCTRTGRAGVIVPLVVSALVMASARAAVAQGESATILGQVRDESSAALPGVAVTLRSPALQVPEMTAVTDERGEYRLTPLPIGIYSVEYALSGFQGLRLENVRLTAGFSAKLDQTMKIGTLNETVTVSGQSPLVDVTQASTATSLDGDAVELIPSGTNGIVGFLSQVPGARSNIDVGGSSVTDTNLFTANGQSGEAWQLLEGVFAASNSNGASGTHYDFNSIDEARVQTSGNSAEMPKRGMMINLITKTGGNSFHGAVEGAFTNHTFQFDNIDDNLRAQGVTGRPRLVTRKDGGAQLGGKIVENKVWFFTNLRYRRIINEIPFTAEADGTPITRPQHQFFQVYKVSGQLNQTNRVVGFFHRYGDSERRGATQFVPSRAMEQNNSYSNTSKLEWQSTRGDWLTFSAQHGRFTHVNQPIGFAPGIPLTRDIVTLQEDGDTQSDGRHSTNQTLHNRAVATMYAPGLFAGNHVFTVGVDNLVGVSKADNPARRSGDYRLLFRDGAPFQIDVFNLPNTPRTETRYWGVYAQDSWTVARRLTLNVGLRAQRDRGWVPDTCQETGTFVEAYPTVCRPLIEPNIFTSFTPRVHAAFDVSGDGRSVIKGGYGRFVHVRTHGYELSQLNLNGNRTMTFAWRDLNGNRDFDPGEVNLNPNGPDFVSGGTQVQGIVNPDERMPTANELSIAFERQLLNDLAVRVGGVYVKNVNVNRNLNPLIPYDAYSIPITNVDPGPDAVVGSSDDPGGTLTYYDFPTALRGAAFQAVQVVNDDAANDTTFKTIELAVTKRLAQDWQLSGSYSATKKHIPFGEGVGNALALTPNAEINVADNTWVWIGKLSGTYMFPKGFIGGFNYNVRNGDRLARQVLLQGGTSVPTLVVNAEPIGSLSLDTVALLDLRLAKRFAMPGGSRLELRLDCFNVLNANPVTSIVVRSGSTFGNATASAGGGQNGTGLTPPRIFQFEAQFVF